MHAVIATPSAKLLLEVFLCDDFVARQAQLLSHIRQLAESLAVRIRSSLHGRWARDCSGQHVGDDGFDLPSYLQTFQDSLATARARARYPS